jgi:hypothetical protein
VARRRARQLAWHRSVRRESRDDAPPGSAAADGVRGRTAGIDAPRRATTGTATCPRSRIARPFGFFSSGGAGQLVDTVGDRPSVTADLAHRTGNHVLRTGGTFEDTRLVTTSQLTGGELVRSLFDGHADHQRFFTGECGETPDSPCNYVPESELTFRTRYTAAYVEDTFSPIPSGVNTGQAGLMWVGPLILGSVRRRDSGSPGNKFGAGDWDLAVVSGMGRSHGSLARRPRSDGDRPQQSVRDVSWSHPRSQHRSRQRVAGWRVDTPGDCSESGTTQDGIATGLEVKVHQALRGGV